MIQSAHARSANTRSHHQSPIDPPRPCAQPSEMQPSSARFAAQNTRKRRAPALEKAGTNRQSMARSCKERRASANQGQTDGNPGLKVAQQGWPRARIEVP